MDNYRHEYFTPDMKVICRNDGYMPVPSGGCDNVAFPTPLSVEDENILLEHGWEKSGSHYYRSWFGMAILDNRRILLADFGDKQDIEECTDAMR